MILLVKRILGHLRTHYHIVETQDVYDLGTVAHDAQQLNTISLLGLKLQVVGHFEVENCEEGAGCEAKEENGRYKEYHHGVRWVQVYEVVYDVQLQINAESSLDGEDDDNPSNTENSQYLEKKDDRFLFNRWLESKPILSEIFYLTLHP